MSVFNRQEEDGFGRGARAVIAYPDIGSSARTAEARLDEAAGLAEAIGISVVERTSYRIRGARPATLFGSGQVEDLAARRAAQAASNPAEVVLFGSYARGDADQASDLDLMVIEDEVHDKTGEYLKIHRAVGNVGVGVDIVVISRAEFDRRRHVPGTVPYWAAKEGRLIHDARG